MSDQGSRPPAESVRFPEEIAEHMAAVYGRVSGMRSDFTRAEAAERAGIDVDFAGELWRAFGLALVDQDTVKAYDEEDVESMRAVKTIMDAGLSKEDILEVARVYGQAFARIAEAEQRAYKRRFLDPMVAAGISTDQIDALEPLSRLMLPLLDPLLRNAHRRQLDVANRQLIVSSSQVGTEPYAVGFVDLVDYSRLSTTLDGLDLTTLISRFDDLALTRCADVGARVVKFIGDAVLFVSPDPHVALEAARAVVTGAGEDAVLPEARAGLDYGEVLPLEGDYFGNPVNVAARIVGVAMPGTVVVSKTFGQALGPAADDFKTLGVRELKGVGERELWLATDPPTEGEPERRSEAP